MATGKPDFFTGWTEPESAANTNINPVTGLADYQPVFPFNNSTQTPSGHAFELDDTPTRERVRLQHRSKTFIEMHPNGDEVHKIFGDGYSITLGDQNISIGIDDGNKAKKLNITVYGDVNLYANGNFIQQVDGDYELHVKGNHSTTVEGLTSFVSQGDMYIKAGTGVGSGIFLAPGNYVGIKGSIRATGGVTASKIFSTGRVDCIKGMSASVGGFTTPGGGISVGTGTPIVGTISCIGPINSLVSMSAPLTSSAISTSFFASDVVNSILRNFQTHPTPTGESGPPIPEELGYSGPA